MPNILDTEHYRFAYTQSVVVPLILWESHCHARFELIAVLEGDITITLEGENYCLTGGQAMLIPPLRYHTITANKPGNYQRVTVLFDISAIPASLQVHFAEKTETSVFSMPGMEELKDICERDNSLFYGPLAEAVMIKTFYTYLEAKHTDVVAETDAFLKRTLAYVDEHLCEKISLDQLAALTARSKSSFCHLFEEKMKISPKQYVLQKKLAFAHKLIREGVPPTAAAFRVGYENYSNFYRLYRKRYGISPASRQNILSANREQEK